MINYKQLYLSSFRYGEQDFIPCEICGNRAVDIHHIEPKGMGGSKEKDHIENLIAVCRECHNKCHDNKITKNEQRKAHYPRLRELS